MCASNYTLVWTPRGREFVRKISRPGRHKSIIHTPPSVGKMRLWTGRVKLAFRACALIPTLSPKHLGRKVTGERTNWRVQKCSLGVQTNSNIQTWRIPFQLILRPWALKCDKESKSENLPNNSKEKKHHSKQYQYLCFFFIRQSWKRNSPFHLDFIYIYIDQY